MKIIDKYLAIALVILLLTTSCSKLDNYPQPNSGIYGTLTDAETGTLLTLPQGEGTIRLLEQNIKYPSPSPIDLPVNSGSGYRNTLMFADQYKVFLLALSGPFIFPSLDTMLVTLHPGSLTQVNFQVIPYYRISATVSDSTFSYTITSSKANTTAGGQLTNVYFMISLDSALNMGAASSQPGSYYPNQFPLSNPSDAILGVQQTFSIPFASTKLPKGTYFFRISCAGSQSDGQYNYSPVMEATVH